jgi:hypothetical protein
VVVPSWTAASSAAENQAGGEFMTRSPERLRLGPPSFVVLAARS